MADIAIRKVFKSYGKEQVVHGVDLDIRSGEFLVILGPSGCGKSTLLRMIAGLEEITGGEVAIADTVVNELEPRERGCAMVFQNYALYPHMSVAENIGYALKVAGMKKAERRAKVEEVARIIGLTDFLDRKPGQLSGGQRQRVAMGRAMIREPKVFLFDEPLSNLDAKLRVQMRLEIRRLHKRLGTTSVFVTHDQIEAMTLADRLVVMNSGHIEQVGTPAEIYNTPASTYVGGFIGSPPMNFLPAEVDRARHALRLPGGQSVPLRDAQLRALTSDLVQAGVRPEALRRAPDPARASLTATFDFAEELGNGRLYHLHMEDMELIMLSDDQQVPRQGDSIGLSFADAALHLFDGQTGARIVPPDEIRAHRPREIA